MSTLTNEIKLERITFSEDIMNVFLSNGKKISVPLKAFPRLLNASAKQRENYRSSGAGTGIHWPEIDEDLSIEWLIEDYG